MHESSQLTTADEPLYRSRITTEVQLTVVLRTSDTSRAITRISGMHSHLHVSISALAVLRRESVFSGHFFEALNRPLFSDLASLTRRSAQEQINSAPTDIRSRRQVACHVWTGGHHKRK